MPNVGRCLLYGRFGCWLQYKDLSKAFDSLQPTQLLKSLVKLGVSSDILKLSMDFMTNRQQRVRIKDASSPYLPITVGVPQGTLTGPMFWLAFINSYNSPLSQCNTMYADDITCTIPVSCSIDDNIQPVSAVGYRLECRAQDDIEP